MPQARRGSALFVPANTRQLAPLCARFVCIPTFSGLDRCTPAHPVISTRVVCDHRPTDGGDGTSNLPGECRQRRRASDATAPERLIANNCFRKFAPVESVTLKPTWRGLTALRRNRPSLKTNAHKAVSFAASAGQDHVLLKLREIQQSAKVVLVQHRSGRPR